MIHTIDLIYHPDYQVLGKFKSDSSTKIIDEKNNIRKNYSLSDKGLTITSIDVSNQEYYKQVIIIRVNPTRLLNKDRIDLLIESEINDFIYEFNTLIKNRFEYLPDFSYWNVKRIDYCVNVQTNYVNLYLKIMKKGFVDLFRAKYDPVKHRRVQKEGSLYLESDTKKKTIRLNYYNKIDEMNNHNLIDETESENLGENILRLETQVLQAKLTQIKNKYKLPTKQCLYYLNVNICFDVSLDYLNKIFLSGDYYKYSIAVNKILNSGYTTRVIENMLAIVSVVKVQHQNLSKCKKQILDKNLMTENQFNYCIKKFNELKVNPVCLSDRGDIDRLENIPSLFSESLSDETLGGYLDRIDLDDTNYYDLICQPW